ncbi:hypothetical protein ACHAWF_016041 [Thalassiosira exigua]
MESIYFGVGQSIARYSCRSARCHRSKQHT